MHLMRSWALLQVTLLSGGLTILLVLDLDGMTGKTEEADEVHIMELKSRLQNLLFEHLETAHNKYYE
jgi:hypothetical protein